MPSDPLHGFRLGPCLVEPLRGAITGSNGVTRHLEPKVMDVFVSLARRPGEVVTRDELLKTVWEGRPVTDESLTRAIRELRHALDDAGGNSNDIETVPKRGYCLLQDISVADTNKPEADANSFRILARAGKKWAAIAAVTVLAISYIVYDKFATIEAPDRPNERVTDSDSNERWKASIAVLPFLSLSDDPGDEWFATGLSEEIRSLLARVAGLKVIGRTSSYAFRGQGEDIRVIGKTLGVKSVLEGSVRKSNDRVRITVQLIDTSDGAHIWSQTYEHTITDIFVVQDEVAAAVIDALQLELGATPTRGRPTQDIDAYALFLKARSAFNSSNLVDAEEMLLQAVNLDPKFADAYVLLADTYASNAGASIAAAEGQAQSFAAAARALAIDPDLALAQAFYQLARPDAYSFVDMVRSFERASREEPSNTASSGTLAWELFLRGYVEEALNFAARNAELDPLEYSGHFRLADAYFAMGRTDDAVAELRLAEHLGSGAAKWALGEANLVEGRDEAAIAYFEAALEQAGFPEQWVRETVHAARIPDSGQAYLDDQIPEIVKGMPEWFRFQAQLVLSNWYLLFGFLDRYFELIFVNDLAPPTWNDSEVLIKEGIKYRLLGFTKHPKFIDLATANGSIDIWEQRGPPDFCEKNGTRWVCQ